MNGSPVAAIVLDWSLKPVSWNYSGEEFASEWWNGEGLVVPESSRLTEISAAIVDKIQAEKSGLDRLRSDDGGPPDMVSLFRKYPLPHRFISDVFYLPRKGPGPDRGTFLVLLHRQDQNLEES